MDDMTLALRPVFIREPVVRLVSRPEMRWENLQAFLEDEGLPGLPQSIRAGEDDSVGLVETAARICYMSFGRGRTDIKSFIDNLLERRDGSVFEHVNYSFVFTGISRSLSHELVRHRAGFAYSQKSQRYVDESERCRFVVPPAILASGGAVLERFEQSCSQAVAQYSALVDMLGQELSESELSATDRRKAVRQAARSVLPNATETKMTVTANVRAWRHFLEMRGSAYADAEIRRLALAVLQVLVGEAPLLFGDFRYETLDDGGTGVWPRYSKV